VRAETQAAEPCPLARVFGRVKIRGLSEEERLHLAAFFEPDTLEGVRLRWLPRFLAVIAGITFGRTVFLSRRWTREDPLPLLFHELVHVVQYERLGLGRFLWRYVRGWTAGGFRYFAIPLEAHAYELQGRYVKDRGRGFSVLREVEERLADY
jgi:hypothetical protein